MIKSKKGITAVEVIVIITIIAILAVIIYGVIVSCLNGQNRITEGVIVDKSCTAEKVITIPYTRREPAHYHFQLELHLYLFHKHLNHLDNEVSEYDYNEYRIEDYYKL